MTADDLVDVVKKEDEQWRTDPGRSVLLCWILKYWYPIDFYPESAYEYDILSRLGGFGNDARSVLQPKQPVCCGHDAGHRSDRPVAAGGGCRLAGLAARSQDKGHEGVPAVYAADGREQCRPVRSDTVGNTRPCSTPFA